MMVAEEEASIRRFVCGQLRDERDLSSLTLRVLKRRYLLHVRCESLSPEARNIMKRVVLEELMKMQDNDKNGSELEAKKLQNKRKREEENDEVTSGGEDESTAKKSRYQSALSSESEDKGSEESEEEEQIKSEDDEREVKKSQQKKNGKQLTNSEDSADEDINESDKEEKESNCGDSPKEMVKNKPSTTKNGERGSSDASQGKKMPQSDKENDTDKDSESEKSDKINGSDSSDDSEKEEKVSEGKKNSDPDSDSSSLSSLENEEDRETKKNTQDKKKNQTEKKQESTKSQKDALKAVVRLKRYIALCGVKRNYKKLLGGCRSVRSQVAVLKKELEDLGVDGLPSIKKCKKVRMKRERDEELAALDISNIIATQGRPIRRGASAWQEGHSPPSSTYLRTLNSGSDSDQENATQRGRRRATDWANLQGIISDDADSD